MSETFVQALDLLSFKAAYADSMLQLGNDVASMSEEDFELKYRQRKFEVASRIGQLQALVKIRPLTSQTTEQISQLTTWFASLPTF